MKILLLVVLTGLLSACAVIPDMPGPLGIPGV